jgi:UPF0042 nucleotide-binding protein
MAVRALEDMGFYCVDNVPPSLLSKFAELPEQSQGKINRVALVVDVRSQDMFSDYLVCLEELRAGGYAFRILFLTCSDAALQTRYKETRRRHPLQTSDSVTISEAIALEREMLKEASQDADYTIDSTMLSATQLQNRVREMFSGSGSRSMVITAMSFGFKYGLPADADLAFDVRCLPNPFYVEELRELTGLDAPVREYVMGNASAKGLEERLRGLLDFLTPLYLQEGKSQLVVCVGCTGGKHRSVVFAEVMREHCAGLGFAVNVVHRDMGRK